MSAIPEKFLSLIIFLGGNLFLGGIFLLAFLSPSQNTIFLFNSAMLIYFVEFLSIHSSGMAFGARKKEYGNNDASSVFRFSAHGPGKNIMQQNPKHTLVFFYAIFVFALGLIFKNWYIPFYFFLSLVVKFFGKSALKNKLQIGLPIFLFLFSTFLAVLAFPFLFKVFPFQPELLQYKIPGSSGLFVDHPQILIVWGVFYFFSVSLAEIILFIRDVMKPKALDDII